MTLIGDNPPGWRERLRKRMELRYETLEKSTVTNNPDSRNTRAHGSVGGTGKGRGRKAAATLVHGNSPLR